MKRFSQRLGIVPEELEIQRECINDPLRNSIWNLLIQIIEPSEESCREHERQLKQGNHGGGFGGGLFGGGGFGGGGLGNLLRQDPFAQQLAGLNLDGLVRASAKDFFKVPLDSVPVGLDPRCLTWLKEKYASLEWNEVYDFLEFIVENCESIPHAKYKKDEVIKFANQILERELSAYRFIDGILSENMSKVEHQALEELASNCQETGLVAAHSHIRAALAMLGERPVPDLRNSIKESISAVESACKKISGDEKGDLHKTLRLLSAPLGVHPALKQAFEKIYAWTSDEEGIRHAFFDDPEANVGFPEAKFMLVSCAAFVNYLLAKADDVGIFGERDNEADDEAE